MRPARALIDLDALRHNYLLARRLHGGRALAVVKANAYGHGAAQCASALGDVADGFAVAFLDEALTLRAAGIKQPILLLEGVFESGELDAALQEDLWVVVHHEEQVRMIERLPPKGALHVWLKVNTGMNRAGFLPHQVRSVWQRLSTSGVVGSITLMTHFARADEADVNATTEQLSVFHSATHYLPGYRSLANSAGVLGWPKSHSNWARPGIMLYGADPVPDADHGLRPVMTLTSSVMAVRDISVGEPLGYGARFRADRPTRVGLVALGYADGYPRTVEDGTPIQVDGTPTRIIGRVSMDMLTVDLTAIPGAGLGSNVEAWGKNLSVNCIAASAKTIAYELLCNVKRVRFEYLNGGQGRCG